MLYFGLQWLCSRVMWFNRSQMLMFLRVLHLTPFVQEHIFILNLLIYRFYTDSETYVGMEIVQPLVINLLTSIDPP